MRIVLLPLAEGHLREILGWTLSTFGSAQALRYGDFLQNEMAAILENHQVGRPVPGDARLRYVTCRFKGRSHGHVIVFKVNVDEILIVGIYHTSQQWQERLADQEP